MANSEPTKMFSLAAVLHRQNGGTVDISLCHAIRGATDGQDAVTGRYVQFILGQNPGYSLSAQVSVMEIDREDMKTVLLETENA